eukprot:scaffold57399_cov30-Tisochrysis_lutea.AAC.2
MTSHPAPSASEHLESSGLPTRSRKAHKSFQSSLRAIAACRAQRAMSRSATLPKICVRMSVGALHAAAATAAARAAAPVRGPRPADRASHPSATSSATDSSS